MNLTSHIVSIGFFVAGYLTMDYFVNNTILAYAGVLVIAYVLFAFFDFPGVDQ